jgi:hypothetical protein
VAVFEDPTPAKAREERAKYDRSQANFEKREIIVGAS